MSRIESDDVYYAARKIQPFLEPRMNETVVHLLAHAESGEKTDNQLLEVLASSSEELRIWLRSALTVSDFERDCTLPGNVSSIPVGSTWVCPNTEHCSFEWYIRKLGQPVPPCPRHHIALIRRS